jgi:antitoxin YefM
MMRAVMISELRTNLAATIDRVIADKDEAIVVRPEGSAVIIDLDEYNSLKETAYLLRSPANARSLFRAIDEIESGRGETHELP